MEPQEQTSPKNKRLKIAIIILAVLLVLSAGGLAARYVYLAFFASTQATVTVPDNRIGESSEPDGGTTNSASVDSESSANQPDASRGNGSTASTASRPAQADKPMAKVLELYQGKPEDNRKFEARNMLPGDSLTQYFCVKAYHGKDITLFFNTEVTEQTKHLGNVLHINVTHMESGKVLCDAPFSEINGKEFSEVLSKNAQEETTAYYQIDVSMDTSVGNEYQAARLLADFNWYVKDEGGLTPPPQTGDTTNLALWIVLAASSLLLILLLLLGRRRKEGGSHE